MKSGFLMEVLTEVVTPRVVEVDELLSDLKAYCRITYDFEDALLNNLIFTAIEQCELFTGRTFVHQTLRSWFQLFNDRHLGWWSGTIQASVGSLLDTDVVIPELPVVSVSSVKTYSDADVETTVDSGTYRVVNQDTDFNTVIRLKEGQTWPTSLRNANAFAVEYIAGYAATASTLPQNLKHAILTAAKYLYDNRGCSCSEALSMSSAGDYLSMYRVMKL